MRRIAIYLMLAGLALSVNHAQSGEVMVGGCGRPTIHGNCCCEHPCWECAPYLLKKSCEEEKENCWTTRCKQIEIPPVRFPWDKSDCCGCEPPLVKCGKVRTVSQLWQNETKVSVPKFEWIRTCLKSCVPCSSAPQETPAPAIESDNPPLPPMVEPPVSAGLSPGYGILPSGYVTPVLLPAIK